jgi:hypothetical protein
MRCPLVVQEDDVMNSSDKEPAEGSRETVDEALRQTKKTQQGVSNRPAKDEEHEQDSLPRRGQRKAE